jgi:short-subunit dehydrogenase
MSNYKNIFNIKKKKVYIVGGLGLIGCEVTKCFAENNANILIIDKDLNKFNKQFKKFKNVKFAYLDLSDTENLENNYEYIIKKNGIPNIFINCSYPKTNLWKNKNNFQDITLNTLKENIDCHLVSYSWLSKITAEKFKNNKMIGSITNFSSIYGLLGQDMNIYKNTGMKENMTYSIIKGGIISLTRQMASYYGKHNIRVNNICAGGVFDNQNKIFVNHYSNKTPLKRMANKEEIAKTTIFLASDAASYITGCTLIVDGGWSIV